MSELIDLHYIDAHLLVAEKPAGLLSVPGRGEANQDCVIARLQQVHAEALTVHRLDQVTSGLLLHALGKPMQAALSALFAARQVGKRYHAVLQGEVRDDVGEVDLPLVVDWPNRPRQKVDHAQGKPALTRWQVLARDPDTGRTRVALEPVTGRSHQLRLHMASLGHPIVGDVLYGAEPASRVHLHASELRFAHPVTGQSLAFHSAPPF
ncbi:RluA family pseudouridine synthase [Stenotrophomonas sp. C3(2023)]|uniref:RluA family pseudouridine synthase n=1 Tax=Stenotrophomonas sp. C3(2023) TaxID=3080277 RepID=UPI00293C4278|nr:RluA family pseudouridine synthase [Stenotrophomonas sp. C3(2023)]MDV3469456.1 RluA family pseudouridine synthase [Stenotrophomonas sp. C3(2023)]